jgi:hypothetical protein
MKPSIGTGSRGEREGQGEKGGEGKAMRNYECNCCAAPGLGSASSSFMATNSPRWSCSALVLLLLLNVPFGFQQCVRLSMLLQPCTCGCFLLLLLFL